MSKKTTSQTRNALTGADHQALALLCVVEGLEQHHDPERFMKYLDAARTIVKSPEPFEGLDNYVLEGERPAPNADAEATERRRVYNSIFEGDDDRGKITATVRQVRDILYSAVLESRLYGAALMFELLKRTWRFSFLDRVQSCFKETTGSYANSK